MSPRSSFLLLACGLVLLAPVASSMSMAVRTPQTRDYIDLNTYLAYHYDATTGTLVPTGTIEPVAPYVCAQAYVPAEAPTDCPTNATCDASNDACTTATTAVVGAVDVLHKHKYVANCTQCACEVPHIEQFANDRTATVTFLRTSVGIPWCGQGFAYAYNYVGGHLRGYDSVMYG